jgi:predicted short-subunit dehydrogenase-like oxidoreductase (DUF2520 family)
MTPSRITIFGSGNLAWHLGQALFDAHYSISQVYSRNQANAEELAFQLGADAISSTEDFDDSCDVAIFAVSDNAIAELANKVNFSGQLVLHTSGSTSVEILKNNAQHYGVLYPLQTFSKFRPIEFRDIPLLIEANTPNNLVNLKGLASALSSKVIVADSYQRRQLHLSAVFANNFVNHMYTLAYELSKKTGLSFDILKPLIKETALKATLTDNPSIAQTGPAVRHNSEIIKKHIEMLCNQPEMQKIYTFVSESISKYHHTEHVS